MEVEKDIACVSSLHANLWPGDNSISATQGRLKPLQGSKSAQAIGLLLFQALPYSDLSAVPRLASERPPWTLQCSLPSHSTTLSQYY